MRITRRELLAACMVLAGPTRAQGTSIIAAASDLQFALPELIDAFRQSHGGELRMTFGASGNLARQIRQGAPFDLFMSADEQLVFDLARDGFLRDIGLAYAVGRIALVTPHGSPLSADGTLDDLAAKLRGGQVTRFAIANPEHAPYGRAAEQALRHKGIWDAIRPRLVLGENVAQAAQFALSANAQGGIIARSLMTAPAAAARGRAATIPAEYHAPLRQRMAATRGAGPVAAWFQDFMFGVRAREILARHGFARETE